MKLVFKQIDKTGCGDVKLLPQSEEDMWHVYNLLAAGDLVTATSFRKIQQTSSTGSSTAQKVRIRLTIEIETVEFDTGTCELRIKGKNTEESEFVKLGQYHTLEIALQRDFSLHKQNWDSIYLERVDIACDLKHSAEIGAVVMQPGLANVCLVTTHMTQVRQKIEMAIPRKRVGSTTTHDGAVKKFFTAVYNAIKHHFDMNIVKVILIASPGFLKEDFMKWMFDEAIRNGDKVISDNKAKFVACQSSSGFKHSLKEVLADPNVSSRVLDTKAFSEVRALDNFFEMLNTDPDRAYYGYQHVKFANDQKAIDTLLVTDELFRSSEMKVRRDYVQLVESVKENGGDVKIFSTLHVSGEQLNQLSGVAALLRFPLAEHDVEDATSTDPQTTESKSEDESIDHYPPSSNIHGSASMHQLSTHLPTAAASSSSTSSSNQFKKLAPPPSQANLSQSVSFGNLSAMKAPPTATSSSTTKDANTTAASKGLIKGFASEHL